MSKNSKKMERSEFLKIMGAATLATAAAGSCIGGGGGSKSKGGAASSSTKIEGELTTRVSTKGDKVAILGYGGTKWPLLENPEPGKSVVDQEAVEELIDYAIAHGVNYFDTAPPYSQGGPR
ncbi:MAG: aldo/keto reductase, partial [Rikenellaceae bacterium]